MTKIYYDDTSLVRLVNPGLVNSINNLRKAAEISGVLNIPYEFKYRSYLNSLDDNLKTNLNTLTSVYNIIVNSSKVYSGISNKLESELIGIENYQISLRETAIK